jgi:nuclease HARBI1
MEGHKILWVYGDPAYRLSYGVMAPYGAAQDRRFLPSRQQAFNKSLSMVRIAVENTFGMVQRLWTYTAFGKSLAAGKQPVRAIFAVAILLTNCHSCLRGNQISERFGVPPPLVEDYLL